MKTAAEIRADFLNFFAEKGHTIVPSAPIVVKNDPTLLFTNAGMNQFKDYFLGNKSAPHARVADTQKCLRVSGKHNDLEEVGVDTYHHTMFEMLGNWSFGGGDTSADKGGYFKKEAIGWSWELLTKVYGIPKENLYVTYFEGDEKEGLQADEESFTEWKKYVAEDHILRGNKKDNFWEMGDTGPCGPCTEIHADCRTAEEKSLVSGATLVNNDHPQVIEIWNNVFIQFNRKKDGSLEELPARHVDTGMGFERLVRVLQGKTSNYDTDIFMPTIEAIEKITSKKYTAGDDKTSIAFRVLADHIRAISFTIADGQLPSNTGAGYVIRRILRRAVRYYYSYMDHKQPLLHELLPVIATSIETVFPELKKQQDFVARVIKEEEEAFLRTLEKGLKRIDDLPKNYWIALAEKIYGDQYVSENSDKSNYLHTEKNEFINKNLVEKNPINISGEMAFELFDTFGFPIDLTRLIAIENSWKLDEEGFEAELKKQKERSRAATVLDTEDWTVLQEGNENTFTGYEKLTGETNILKYRKVSSKAKDQYQLVLQETPFYAESGGQIGDTGTITVNGHPIKITNTKKENGLIIHFADELPEGLDSTVSAQVDEKRRKNIAVHHSVTHLMHAALRKVLGTHVAQKGSLVSHDYLRFDFSHFAKMTAEEITEVEEIVNEKIRENQPVIINTMGKEEAVAMGAMALFGEKYGDNVRVVVMDKNYSIELCGGTHVGNTGEIGFFKITAETAVAAGVRRIEAVSGRAAEKYIEEAFTKLLAVGTQLKNIKDPVKAIENLQAENSKLSKHIENLEARQLVTLRNEILQKDEIIDNVNFIGQVVEVPSADSLKKISVDIQNHLRDYVVVLCANVGGKAAVSICISETVAGIKKLDAAKMIKEIVASQIKGGGGGTATLATAGGQETGGFKNIIDAVKEKLNSAI